MTAGLSSADPTRPSQQEPYLFVNSLGRKANSTNELDLKQLYSWAEN
jgi:hypothetical protein